MRIFLILTMLSICPVFCFAKNDASKKETPSQNESINWLTNYELAVLEAQQQKKPILILFTGSDWCSFCVRLEKEVFSTPEFAKKTKDKFIFLKADYPIKKKLNAEEIKQNNALQTLYQVKGFPSVVVLSSSQDILGNLGYEVGGPDKYADQLLELINKKAK